MTDLLEKLKIEEHTLRMSKAPREEVQEVVNQIAQLRQKQIADYNQLLKDEEMGFVEGEK